MSKNSKISHDFGVPEESAESSKFSETQNHEASNIKRDGSFINLNYDSPNINDIRKQRRR